MKRDPSNSNLLPQRRAKAQAAPVNHLTVRNPGRQATPIYSNHAPNAPTSLTGSRRPHPRVQTTPQNVGRGGGRKEHMNSGVQVNNLLSVDSKKAVLPGSPGGPGEPCHPAVVPTRGSAEAETRLSARTRVTHGGGGWGCWAWASL